MRIICFFNLKQDPIELDLKSCFLFLLIIINQIRGGVQTSLIVDVDHFCQFAKSCLRLFVQKVGQSHLWQSPRDKKPHFLEIPV